MSQPAVHASWGIINTEAITSPAGAAPIASLARWLTSSVAALFLLVCVLFLALEVCKFLYLVRAVVRGFVPW